MGLRCLHLPIARFLRTKASLDYMAASESAKARIRFHSAPRQRPATSKRDRQQAAFNAATNKQLSFPVPLDPYGGDVQSLSFKSASGHFTSEERSIGEVFVVIPRTECGQCRFKMMMRTSMRKLGSGYVAIGRCYKRL